jgi:hypothetical protein
MRTEVKTSISVLEVELKLSNTGVWTVRIDLIEIPRENKVSLVLFPLVATLESVLFLYFSC